jgi:hypothetical protein
MRVKMMVGKAHWKNQAQGRESLLESSELLRNLEVN